MRRAAIALSAEERMIADGGLWQLEASDERESANPTLGRGRLASRPWRGSGSEFLSTDPAFFSA